MLTARMALRAVKSRFVDHQPFILSHLLTARCNAECVTCLWKASSGTRMDELSAEEVQRMYRDAGEAGYVALVLWGGEPLLRPDVAEDLRVAQEAGMQTTLITNGWALEPRAAEIGPYVDRLMVSVDNVGPDHDESRGLPGLWERLDAGVRRIRADHPDVFVIINVVLSQLNLGRLEEIATYAREHADLVSFQAMNEYEYGVVDRSIDGDALRLSPEQERETVQVLIDLKRRGFPVEIPGSYLALLESGEWSYRCHFKKVVLRVEPNGEVMDCTVQGHALTNVRQVPLAEIPRLPAYTAFTARAESCSQCRDFGTVEVSHMWEGRFDSLWSTLKIMR